MLPIAGPPVADGAVATRDGAIACVGPAERVLGRHPGLPVEDLGDLILAPGLVDAHCHLEWSLLDGLLPSAPFADWLGRLLPMRRSMTPADHLTAARWGALRALRAGTTTLADSGPTGAGARALGEAGLRGRVHLEAFGRERGDAAEAAAEAFAARVAALDAAAGGRVEAGVSPHAPYTVGPELWRALRARADLRSRPWATHVAESAAEEEAIATGDGPLGRLFAAGDMVPGRWAGPEGAGVVGRLRAAGALAPGLVAAHCVGLRPGDAEALADEGVRVAHCPRSNRHLMCGRAPIEAMTAAGVRLGLGTDSPASGGDYDLRREARAAQGEHAGVVDLGPGDLLRLATLGGARALDMEDLVGSLEEGKRADLIGLRPAGPAPDPIVAAMLPGSAVALVVVDGEPLLRDGAPLRMDAEAVATGADEARSRLC